MKAKLLGGETGWPHIGIDSLRMQPDDAAALKNWRTGTILSVTVLECVVLFGLATYATGATLGQVAPFFILPIVTMLFSFPKRP